MTAPAWSLIKPAGIPTTEAGFNLSHDCPMLGPQHCQICENWKRAKGGALSETPH